MKCFFADGEKIEDEESKLLEKILNKAGVSLTVYGVDIQQLADGQSNLTYEEMQFMLKNNPATHLLSVNLKEELKARTLCDNSVL